VAVGARDGVPPVVRTDLSAPSSGFDNLLPSTVDQLKNLGADKLLLGNE
jgi:hypothetical protein